MIAHIERLWRRLQLMVGRGRISGIDDSGPVQLLQVKLGADETKDSLPRVVEFGFTSNPPAGTDALVLFLAGERTNGVVIGTNSQALRLRALASGEVAIYDSRGRHVLLGAAGVEVEGKDSPITATTTGDATVTAGGNITLTAGPKITLSAAEVDITGALNVAGAAALQSTLAVAGDAEFAGAMTNNGHDAGHGHTHLPGTFKANSTAITGVSGAVTP